MARVRGGLSTAQLAGGWLDFAGRMRKRESECESARVHDFKQYRIERSKSADVLASKVKSV